MRKWSVLKKPAVLALLLSALLIMSVPVFAEEVPEQKQPDISETVPMAVAMTDAVEAIAWPYYNSSAN